MKLKTFLSIILSGTLLFSFVACSKNTDPSGNKYITDGTATDAPAPTEEALSENIVSTMEPSEFKYAGTNIYSEQGEDPKSGETIAVMETSMGEIKIKFFPQYAPLAVENFLVHAEKGYFDNNIFHRVSKGFMAQGGDVENRNGTGGKSIWNKPFKDEFNANVKNKKNALAMANSGKNTNGSQFFINFKDNSSLNNVHTVFGEVIEGFETLDKINNTPVSDATNSLGEKASPNPEIVIKKVTIETWK